MSRELDGHAMVVSRWRRHRLPSGWCSLSLACEGRSARAGKAPKDRSEHESRPTGVIVIEDAAGDLASRKQAGDGDTVGAQDLSHLVDHHPAVGEGDTAADAERDERWLVQAEGPIGFRWHNPLSGLAVLNGRVERSV